MTSSDPRPPRIPALLASLALPSDPAGRSVLGDLYEEYGRRGRADAGAARRWYWRVTLEIVLHRIMPRRRPTPLSNHPRTPLRRGDPTMLRFLTDLRYAARTLRRAPSFTIVVVATLALGIGANTAIFSVVNGVLIQPLPFPDADRVVGVFHSAPGLGYDQFGISPSIYFHYEDENQVFAEMMLFTQNQTTLTGDGDPERVGSVSVSLDAFSLLGITPIRGRPFTEGELLPNGPDVMLISHELWMRRFAGTEDIIGRTILTNGRAREVVGVLPPDPGFPDQAADVWFPLNLDRSLPNPGQFGFNALARLRPDVSIERAQADLGQLVNRLREEYANIPPFIAFLDQGQFSALVKPLKEELVGDLRQPLFVLLGTVGVVLLIVCANVTNLCLVRAEARRREMAVRSALGAARRALVRQYLAESALLAAVGGGVGVVLALLGVPMLLRAAPPTLPRLDEVSIDLSVLLFAGGVSVVSGVFFGLVPAVRNSGGDLLPSLTKAGRGTTSGRGHHIFRSGLVITQTALALVLLVSSGLLVRSFVAIRETDPGFDPTDVLTLQLSLPGTRYEDAVDVADFHQRLLDRLATLPGIVSVGGVSDLPLAQQESGTAHEIEGQPVAPGELPPMFWFSFASPGYFETMRIPVIAGRTFERRDNEDPTGAVIVSSTLAERLWPGEDPLGRRLRTVGDTTGWETVVGVVGSVRSQGLREEPIGVVYRPLVGRNGPNGQGVRGLTYAIRAPNAAGLTSAIRAAVWELDPELPLTAVQTMVEVVGRSVIRLSFTMMALVVSAVLAVALGAIGLYGVLSYLVAQRRQEIGLRIALGAQAANVRQMVVRQGATMAAIGLGVGLVGSAAVTRLLEGLLFGTAPLDPVSFSLTSLALMAVVVLASYIPARRASTVDPIEALRT